MQDLYIIKDNQGGPNHLEQLGLRFVGEPGNKTSDNLQNKGIIKIGCDSQSDFMFGTALIEQIRKTLTQIQIKLENAAKKINSII